jgi:cell division protein ZapE
MLMDMFFVSVQSSRKRRVHFHIFMLEVHRWIHSRRRDVAKRDSLSDPIPVLAHELSSKIDLLCFDEFEINDVADALIMRRVFSSLLDYNVRIVMTSNWHPDELYVGGLQREMFIPFINYLKAQLEVVPLGNDIDYRLLGLRSKTLYFSPLNENTQIALEEAFCSLTGGADSITEEMIVEGRQLIIRRANQGIAWVTFNELCEEPVGVSDYLAIITRFHTLVMSSIPIMLPQHRNEARRFAILVDMLYDHNVKLICSAAGGPEELYARGTGAREFMRTASRLREMQTSAYLSRSHGFKKP